MRRAKSLRIGVHHADAVVWGPVCGTRLHGGVHELGDLVEAFLAAARVVAVRRGVALSISTDAVGRSGGRGERSGGTREETGLDGMSRPSPTEDGGRNANDACLVGREGSDGYGSGRPRDRGRRDAMPRRGGRARCRARGTRTAPPPPSLFDAAVALERSFMTRAAIERPRGRPTLRHPLESSRRAKGSVAFFFSPPRVRRRRPGGSCPRSARESGRRATCARAVRCGRCDACGARDVRRCASSRPELSR
jgi:hypothetical protein